MTPRTTHLDRVMTELGLENHQLAAKVPTSRQAIYKLRNGNTRMLPHWAKRLAPHLGVSWQELVDGPASPVDQVRAELLAAYDVMSEEQRIALMVLVRSILPRTSVAKVPSRLNRLMGRLGFDDLSMDVTEEELTQELRRVEALLDQKIALKSSTSPTTQIPHKERAPPTPITPGKERPPPRHPTVGEPGETKREAGRPR